MDKFKHHHHKDRCVRKSASVSDQIIEYYYKFGQNRDLEKFLRLRRSSSYNKSSSEGSLSIPDMHEHRHIRCSRSLNHLEKRDNKSTESSNSTKNVSTTTEDVGNDCNDHRNSPNLSENRSKTSSSDCSGELIENIQFSSKEQLGDMNKKSYSFSCESNIAINIRSPSCQSVSMPNLRVTRKSPEMITEESQTSLENNVPETDTPPNKPTEPKTSESVVKSNKRLEWDSLADVGYKNTVAKTTITSLERSVLKEFFAERGIEVSFPVDNNKLSQIDEESKIQKSLSETQGAIPKNSHEKWRSTLDTIKKKYLSSSSLCLNKTENFSKVPQSTPKTLKEDLELPITENVLPNTNINANNCQPKKVLFQSKETQFPSQNSSLVSVKKLNSKINSALDYNCNQGTQFTPNTNMDANNSQPKKVLFQSKETQFPSQSSSLVSVKKLNYKINSALDYNCNQGTQYTPTSSSVTSSRRCSRDKSVSLENTSPNMHRFPKHKCKRSYSSTSSANQPLFYSTNTKNWESVTNSGRTSGSNDSLQADVNFRRCIGFEFKPNYQSEAVKYALQKVNAKEPNERIDKQFMTRSSLSSSESKNPDNYSQVKDQEEENKLLIEPNLETIEQKMENLEKYCQTSFIRTQSQEVQVNLSKRSSAQSSLCLEPFTSPSSFEYIANHSENSDKENEKPKDHRILSEQNSNKSSSTDKSLRNSIHKLFEKQQLNGKVRNKIQKSDGKKSNDLELGVQLLCSLIESKNLNDKQKKSLARKIVMKITKHHCESEFLSGISTDTNQSSISLLSLIDRVSIHDETKSNSANSKSLMSGIQTLNNTSDSEKLKKSGICSSTIKKRTTEDNQLAKRDLKKESQPTVASLKLTLDEENSNKSVEEQATMGEWLDPLTISEKNYDKKKNTPPNSQKSNQGIKGEKKSKNNLKDDIQKECESNLSWIELEIQRLEDLKSNLKAKEELINQDVKVVESARSISNNSYATVASSQDSLCQRNKLSKPQLSEGSSNFSFTDNNKTLITEIKVKKSLEDVVNPAKDYRRSVVRTTKDIIVYDKVKPSKKNHQQSTKVSVFEQQRFPKSRYEMRESIPEKNRSKLETPRSNVECESIRTFAQQRKKDFLDLYENKEHCYDRPADFDHYSEPRECRTKQTLTKDEAYSTRTSSNFCISSESMSVPITSSSSITTTHQYDNQCGIGVQTSDSVLDTIPFYGTEFGCPKITTRVYKQGKNQIVQVKPKSVAYNITFNRDSKFNSKNNNMKNKEEHANNYCVRESGSSSSSLKGNVYNKQVLEENDRDTSSQIDSLKTSSTKIPTNTKSKTNSRSFLTNKSTSTQESNDSLTLQEHLRNQRPEFFKNTTERQMVLKKLNCERHERNEIIRDIIENTSIHSIPRKLEQLPPPPIQHTKIFTTKEKKALTKKKYSKLADVQAKIDRENEINYKKNYRVLTKVFNKKLQRRVHSGQPSLNLSTTVI